MVSIVKLQKEGEEIKKTVTDLKNFMKENGYGKHEEK